LPAAVSLGRLGGGANTPAQQAARKRNAKLGGWPKDRKRGPRKGSLVFPTTAPIKQGDAGL
jgi:hypothetical protein